MVLGRISLFSLSGGNVDLDDIDYDNLPEDPGQAFLVIERVLRQTLSDHMNRTEQKFWSAGQYDYMNNVFGAAKALELTFLNEWNMQGFGNMSENLFRNFMGDVDQFVTKTRILQGRRNRGYSVAFDLAAKTKIRHYLKQIRVVISKAEIDDRKREALYARIVALESELDRARSRFEAVGAYIIEASGVLGEAGKKLEPLANSIAKVFGLAKSQEDAQQSLPTTPPMKKLNPPVPPTDDDQNFNDDIPF